MTFKELNIIAPILKAIESEGYITPSPIQAQAIPVLFEGHDLLASAQTGTGKTAAFAVPILQALYNNKDYGNKEHIIKALILAPTRELAEQIKDSFRTYSKQLDIRTEVVYGGVSQRTQEKALNRGIDILIATPGRLMDLMAQKLIDLRKVEYFVLDEADLMLDMGFIHDVRRIIVSMPKERQTSLFSATMPKEILRFAAELLTNPVRIEVTPPEAMIDKIKQSVFFVTKKDKTNLLLDILIDPKHETLLIFTRTKHGANKLVKDLISYGLKANAIHGDKTQHQRQQALDDFKNKKLRILVATDIAARGIDIDELSHVINYDLPETPETYVHRMGRTGRAGLSGEAYSFCSQEENNLLKDIERHIKMSVPVNEKHEYHVSIRLDAAPDVPAKKLMNKVRTNSRTSNGANKQTKQRDDYGKSDKFSRKPNGDSSKKSYDKLEKHGKSGFENNEEKNIDYKANKQSKSKAEYIKSAKLNRTPNSGYSKNDFDKPNKVNSKYLERKTNEDTEGGTAKTYSAKNKPLSKFSDSSNISKSNNKKSSNKKFKDEKISSLTRSDSINERYFSNKNNDSKK